jgi:PAS domain-containing protein
MNNERALTREARANAGPVPADSWFRDMAEASGEIYFVLRLRPDLQMEFISDTVEAAVGYSAAAIIAEPELLLQIVDPRDVGKFEDVSRWEPGRKELHELRWIHLDGHVAFSQAWVRCREREDGSVALDGMSHDITEIREVELTRALFEERYRLMAESADRALYDAKAAGRNTARIAQIS